MASKEKEKPEKIPLDYDAALIHLQGAYVEAEKAFADQKPPAIPKGMEDALDSIFKSNTQAYREALIGTVLARVQSREIDLTLPYVKHGPKAYNARELDQRIINPFLREKEIPISSGPFLSALRRGIRFVPETMTGIRDKVAFQGFLDCIAYVGKLDKEADILAFLVVLLYRFLLLREQSNIELAKVQRLSIAQYDKLIANLLVVKSGGQIPVFIVVAVLRAIKDVYALDWEIQFQGINVADAASEEPGDISISQKGKLVLAAEVTERAVEKSRVTSTFAKKISKSGVEDYIFFVKFRSAPPEPDAMKQAEQYFAQGHAVNFTDIRLWAVTVLITIGTSGRAAFNKAILELLGAADVKRNLKVAWNAAIQELTKI